MNESREESGDLDLDTVIHQHQFNEIKTRQYAESVAVFCQDAEELRGKFLEDFDCWFDAEQGDVHYLAKEFQIELFSFARCCSSLYTSWRAARLLNEDVKAFNGIRLHELFEAVQAFPRDSLKLGRAYELFDDEVKFLRLLINTRESADCKSEHGAAVCNTAKKRLNALRDATWVKWEDDGLTHAKIRDRWNRENPDNKVKTDNGNCGRDTVKNAISRERKRQKN